MRRLRRAVVVMMSSLVCCAFFASCNGNTGKSIEPEPDGASVGGTDLQVRLDVVVSGLEAPVFVTHAGDARLFIVEQPGRIRVVANGVLLPTPLLDITTLVGFGGERGLLSMAFHPAANTPGADGAGFFWVNYTDINDDTVIARYTVSDADPNVADSGSARILLTIPQPFGNHNGGQLQFGPVEGVEQKRYLYIGMGDGGSGGDPQNNAQNDETLLGKMLRIDPSTASNPVALFYRVPPDNPHVGEPAPLDTMWAKGLRNPWRFAFDAATGALYIADVGQNAFEEIHITPAGTAGAFNYGWRIMEGLTCFDPPSNCATSELTLPVFAYGHDNGRCSITGGYVYRGSGIPELVGTYLFADFCSRELFGLNEVTPGVWERTLLLAGSARPLTFGEDVDGEVYVGSGDGTVARIVPE